MANQLRTGLLALLFYAGGLFGQRYSFKYYGQENGLSNLDILCLLQDRTGFLWVGTDNGLYRYDGRHFRMFGTADGLPSMQVYTLAESLDGTLWAGSIAGLARRVGDRFENVDLKPAKGTRAMVSDAHNRLIVSTERGLLVGHLNGRSPPPSGFRLYSNPEPGPAYGVAVDAAGKVWYGCGDTLCRFDGTRVHSLAGWGVPPDRYTGILADARGNVWARSISRLLLLPAGSRRFVVQDRGLAMAVRLGGLYTDRSGEVLVPTAQGLACRRPGGDWQIVRQSNGLPGNAVSCALEDREGSLWIGVAGVGLVRWLGRRRWESWTEAEGLGHNMIWSIRRDTTGTLWAATENGLSRFDEQAKGWRPWLHPTLHSGRILALAAAPDGTLWAGHGPCEVVQIDARARRAATYGHAEGLPHGQVYSLAIDTSGHIWAGTTQGLYQGILTGGAVRFGRIQLVDHESPPSVSAVVCDGRHRVWAATSQGLFVLQAGRWQRLSTRDGLLQNGVTYLGEGAGGSMWIAYREPLGVSQLILEGGRPRWHHFSRANGLHSDKALFLGSDTAGRVWVGTDLGVEAFDGRSWVHYDKTDGLIWNDCDAYSFFADRDGSVWLGTSRGLSHFYAAGAPPRPSAAPVVLTASQLGDRWVPPGGGLSAPYSLRAFYATFAAMTFANEESVRFRYRLRGLEPAWSETRNGEARYQALPPGEYTFEVGASAAGGPWSPRPATFVFQIRPPWWLTWWAVAADIVLCILVGRRIWKWRLRSILHRQAALERAVAERTRALTEQKVEIERLFQKSQESARLKSEFLANISHEIRTPMNGIIGMTDLVLRTELEREQAECLRLVKVSADSLLSVINDVLDFSKIEAGKFDLDVVEFKPPELLRDAVKCMEVLAIKKGLTLRCHIDAAVPERALGDPVRLRQVLLNLMGNAIKFTARGGVEVEMGAECGDAVELRFAVRDSGIGIPEEKQKLIFEPFRQADGSTSRQYGGTGLGLAICARLVGLMQGRIWVESRPGAGSTFYFTAAVGRSQEPAGAAPARNGEPMPAPARRLHVLIAEDNEVNRKLASRILEHAGHTVICANDGRDAVDAFGAERFDVVLMDVQMPRMDGFAATTEIRKLEAALRIHTPVVALTANAMRGDRERCLRAGMDGYVPKPLKAAELLRTIAELTSKQDSAGRTDAAH